MQLIYSVFMPPIFVLCTPQLIASTSKAQNFLDISEDTREVLFTILEDVSMDTALRAVTFTTLAMTSSEETINRLIVKLQSTEEKEQFLAYMKSYIRTLLDKDHPEEQE